MVKKEKPAPKRDGLAEARRQMLASAGYAAEAARAAVAAAQRAEKALGPRRAA